MGVATNPDLPNSYKVPGVYIALDLSGSGAQLNSIAKRLLLIGYKLGGGSAPLGSPLQVLGKSDVYAKAGRGSDLARLYQAALSQVGQGVLDVFILPIPEPSGGVASTYLMKFAGTATAAGAVTAIICGYPVTVRVSNGDPAATVAAAMKAAIDKLVDIPVTAGIGTTDITLTYRHLAANGEDMPISVDYSFAPGITVNAGTLTYATAATGAGSATVTIGATVVTAALAGGESAVQVATKVAAAINAGDYQVTASDSGAGVLTLRYAPGRYVRRISAAIITTTGTTVTPAVGTTGSGAPTLTNPLTTMAGQAAFKCWVPCMTDTASLGTFASHIEAYADGRAQKGQRLFAASTLAMAVAGAIPAGTSPALTATTIDPRYRFGWCPNSPQQAYELAARHAARVCFEDVSANLDYEPLASRDGTPLLLPAEPDRFDPETANTAMVSYYMTPYFTDIGAGQLQIMTDRTTSSASDARLHDGSTIDTLDFYRFDMNGFLRTRFKQKKLKLKSQPRTPKTITLASVKDAVIERLMSYDDQDLFDGAAALKGSVQVAQNAFVPQRIDIFIPCNPPTDVHQLSAVAGLI